MEQINIPRLNNNDDSCVFKEWKIQSGAVIKKGDIIAVLETSKSTYELESEYDGIIECVAIPEDEYLFTAVIGHVFSTEAERVAFKEKQEPHKTSSDRSSITITKGAQTLIEAHGISKDQILGLKKSIIKRKDIEQLIAKPTDEACASVSDAHSAHMKPVDTIIPDGMKGLKLSKRQQGIAKVVSRSKQTIPAAFLAMKMDCDKALRAIQQYVETKGVSIGFSEFLIKAIAKQADQFPYFFGHLKEDSTFLHSMDPGIGITHDVGKGLFIPVIRNACSKPLDKIAEELIDYRVKAIRDEFDSEDLSDGHISLSLNTEADVDFVVPIILPDQSCMISIGSIQEQVTLKENLEPTLHKFISMGFAYDHRVINGFDAVQFAKQIKDALVHPEQILV